MVKILVIGDFHGEIPKKLNKKINKESFDLIVTPGDFCGNKELGRLFFKYVYGKNNKLVDVIGKKKVKELELKNFYSGINVLKNLNSFNKPVIGVTGNWDPSYSGDIGYPKVKDPYKKRFDREVKKLRNVKIIDFKNFLLDGFNFIGYPRSSYPGFIDKNREKKVLKIYGKDGLKIIKKTKEDNKAYHKKFKKLFFKNKLNIFISHNCPYKTKLDKIKIGSQKGKHYGSWLTKELIKNEEPELVICGHMHENTGIDKIGESLVINPGASYEGKAAILEIDNFKKIKVKFLK